MSCREVDNLMWAEIFMISNYYIHTLFSASGSKIFSILTRLLRQQDLLVLLVP